MKENKNPVKESFTLIDLLKYLNNDQKEDLIEMLKENIYDFKDNGWYNVVKTIEKLVESIEETLT